MSMSPPDSDDDPPPLEPVPPGDNECCGSGCDPCVFDLYNEARRRYLADLQAWQQRQDAKANKPG
ncbi:oxidoreductase-like domain-containing protein [Caldimonas tepidiphila]|uniref:oxidoreductase-like domain-containing protein n=1 Tax=Caldimonas tepidiphila TaxID=2315841 RepID=UPI000E5BEC94|nr:oxidoreductase-like domain-containing protein [Caldimonas tepidiphila]